ncbi:hypothetical protein, partial [Streptomyces antimicrobicus]
DGLVVLAAPYSGRGGGAARRRAGERRRRKTAMTAGLGLLIAALGSFVVARITAEAPASATDRASSVVLTDDGPAPDPAAPSAPAGAGTVRPTLGQAPKPSGKATAGAGKGPSRSPVSSPSASTSPPAPSTSGVPSPSGSGGPTATTGPTAPGSPRPGTSTPPPGPSPTPTKSCSFWDRLFGQC